MTPFEQQVGAFLLGGDHPSLASLREQWAVATVSEREVRNEFFYNALLTLHADCRPLFIRGGASIDDVRVEVVGHSEPLQLRLCILNGRIERLNGFSEVSAGPWPDPLQVVRIFYVGGPNGTRESPTRDLEWALRDVIRAQSEPVRLFLDNLPEQADFWELLSGAQRMLRTGNLQTCLGEAGLHQMRLPSRATDGQVELLV
ncbi:MAG: hypothetical protein K8U57_11315 [Planctomycetes bacterium]|nr:hypothetical protein [Planctomycetota bacterium]